MTLLLGFPGMVDGQFDVIVVGGGPSGSSCAMYLGRAGLKVLLVDKERFPRDKVCGDAQGGKAMKVMRELGLHDAMEPVPHVRISNLVFSSPKGTVLTIRRPAPAEGQNGAPAGYVSRRQDFDDMLFQRTKNWATVMEGFAVTDLVMEDGFVRGIKGLDLASREPKEFRARVVVGADGAASIVAKKLGVDKNPDDHDCLALRAYYENVEGLTDGIELHFVKGLIPGYFWIFPLPNKAANVGVGMVVSDMKAQKVNLKEAMLKIIAENPLFKDRFKDAKLVGDIRGWMLPFGSHRRKAHYNGAVLLGDAAGLIDPFSGEGVGNGMLSAREAARVIEKALKANDVSERVLKEYEDALWAELGPELQQSYRLQKLGRNTFLLNLVIDKAARSQQIRETLSGMLVNEEARKEFNNPLFYLKLLFA